jgi:hypothetical protein
VPLSAWLFRLKHIEFSLDLIEAFTEFIMASYFNLGDCAKAAGLLVLHMMLFKSTNLVTPLFLYFPLFLIFPSIFLLNEIKLLIVFDLWQASSHRIYQKLIEVVSMLEFDITRRE